MRLKVFATLAAAALALLGATGARAADAAAVSEEYMIPNHPHSLQLHELALREVSVQTRLRDGDGKDMGKVAVEAALREWTHKAVRAVGYRLTGDPDDPRLVLFSDCEGRRCETFAWLVRDAYIRKVDGNQQYFVRIPDIAVGEWSSVYSSKLDDDIEKALEQAVYGSVRGAMIEFSKAVIEAQKPDVLAREKRLFTSPVTRGAGTGRRTNN